MTDTQISAQQKRSGRRAFIVLVLIFFGPLIVAWTMYFSGWRFMSEGVTAAGELIQPPVPLAEHAPTYLMRSDDFDYLRGRWALLLIANDDCNQACDESLVLMRQVRLSLGKYMDRIDRVLVISEAAADMDKLQTAFEFMQVVTPDAHSANILQQTESAAGEWIYLVDPLGNLMMRFAHDEEPRPMYKDLKRLLKLSRIG